MLCHSSGDRVALLKEFLCNAGSLQQPQEPETAPGVHCAPCLLRVLVLDILLKLKAQTHCGDSNKSYSQVLNCRLPNLPP